MDGGASAPGNNADGNILDQSTAGGDGELELVLGIDETLVLEECLDRPPHAALGTVQIHTVEGGGEAVVSGHVAVGDFPVQHGLLAGLDLGLIVWIGA